jgi:cobalt/nickel transport system permease protein
MARIIRKGFLERTLSNISLTLEQSIFAEELAHTKGVLQSIDPRPKCIGLVAFLLAINLSYNLPIILGFYLITILLAFVSAIPLRKFILRVWLFIPIFTGIIALPAIFITPGPVLVKLPLGLVITQTGLTSSFFLISRVATSISLTILLILTTPWNSILKSLKVFQIPDVVVLILGMTYRYIYLLLFIANDMFLSRKSRVIGKLDGAEERKLLGATAGVLLSRSLQVSTEVYLAMQSRGFYRTPKTLDPTRMKPSDWVLSIGFILASGLTLWVGR